MGVNFDVRLYEMKKEKGIIRSLEEMRPKTVSYTHLDVYKRQAFRHELRSVYEENFF